LAESNGVGDLSKALIEGLTRRFDWSGTTGSSKTFIGEFNGSRKTVVSLIPGESNPDDGVRFQVYINRLVKYLKTDAGEATSLLPENKCIARAEVRQRRHKLGEGSTLPGLAERR